MFKLKHYDEKLNYKIYQSSFIVENQKILKEQAEIALSRYDFAFREFDSTWFYRYYNFFQMTAGFPLYYKIFKDLCFVVKDYVQVEEPLWLQCWINRHSAETVLKRHNHMNTICFGYFSIDPKNTETIFDDYVIENKVGQLYIGPNEAFHEVKVLSPFEGNRITIAFDVLNQSSYDEMVKSFGNVDLNIGYWPI
jgi:hypothetical protein